MFGLGRRKNQFKDRYNRIGSGQRIGAQPAEEALTDEAAAAPDQTPDLDNAERDAKTDIHLDQDHCGTGEAEDAAPTEREDDWLADWGSTDPDDPEIAVQGADPVPGEAHIAQGDFPAIENQQVADPHAENVSVAAAGDPTLPSVHANGHDYPKGEGALPSWLDSFDPGKPPVKPPELPQYRSMAPLVAGKVLDDSSLAGNDGSSGNAAVPAPKPSSLAKSEPVSDNPEPAPSWLDIARNVESRPPPMPFDGTAPEPADEDHADPETGGDEPPLAAADDHDEPGPETAKCAADDPVDGEAVRGEPEIDVLTAGEPLADEKSAETVRGQLPRPVADAKTSKAISPLLENAGLLENTGAETVQSISPRADDVAGSAHIEPAGTWASAAKIEIAAAKLPPKAIAPPVPLPPPM